ncbi:hypothetical protein [Mycolicibacterium nivoides]|uniref:Uncharacterized protein n=1 Tax=Mycolicibacterium nivoides TaxID=2487344 RepID=A0ABW9LKL5_9MYCO
MATSDYEAPTAEPGTVAYEAERAAAARQLAEVLSRVDVASLTMEQLQTIVLEMDLEFGVPAAAAAERESGDRSGDVVAELQAAFDRLAADALATARETERRICDQITALSDVEQNSAEELSLNEEPEAVD